MCCLRQQLCIHIPDKTQGHFISDIIKKYFAKSFRLSFLCIQGARVNGDIEFVGDAVQYFGFNKQVLVQTKKEMHTVVNCRMLCTVDPKQFCTLYFVFLPGV